eukprot:COSAG01_NODE_2633_length_7333_cov_89.156760_10_plen_166_part_00
MPCHSPGATGVRSVRGLCPTPAVGNLQLKEEGEKQPELAAVGGGGAASAGPSSSSSVGLIVSDRQHGLYWLQVRGWAFTLPPPRFWRFRLEFPLCSVCSRHEKLSRSAMDVEPGDRIGRAGGSCGYAQPRLVLWSVRGRAHRCRSQLLRAMLRACVRACVRALPP